ncbi:ERAD-associated E3 ubiquitin- ligase doa10 [Lecanosticta acicola]|uniref:RING-type E3 ubiquitin transferase n=1 Tax=Lecanosticta acicola TaxID=111012 RepID=A0AAI9ECB0_9PEZI|nr:ERAD-associated E3 ubiquitin- ligase doa10 [Lecanosticta acicola]
MDDSVDPDAVKFVPSPDAPDIMNDPAFAPPQRRDTTSSKFGSESAFGADTCRICRSEDTPQEPLFYPCKCSGSIKFVHQECLMEWLSHSHKKHCELCKTPFRFTKLYDANMPKRLPWTVFARRACVHAVVFAVQAIRALLVSSVWLVVLPYMIRWAWRWMFWFADAGWARETFIRKMQPDSRSNHTTAVTSQVGDLSFSDTLYTAFEQVWHGRIGSAEAQHTETTVDMISGLVNNAFNATPTVDEARNATDIWPRADVSILSSWTYISEMTASPQLNGVILDVFEGQLITCVVITGFILVFLIREWVVQQQPLVNLDNLNHEQRERERLVRERERLMRQAELLDQARERLATLQAEAEALEGESSSSAAGAREEFKGWENLSSLIDSANKSLQSSHAEARDEFEKIVREVMAQVRVSNSSDSSAAEVAEKVYGKLALLSDQDREAWEEIFVSELKELGHSKEAFSERFGILVPEIEDDANSNTRRPPMPTRDTISRATQIQRILEEADIALSPDGRHHTSSPTANAELGTESASVVSDSSTEGSWQQVSPPEEPAEQVDHRDIFQDENDEIPITNAGPDAKVNIKRTGKKNAKSIVPEPKPPSDILSNEELMDLLKQGEEIRQDRAKSATAESSAIPASQQSEPTETAINVFHFEGAEPEKHSTDEAQQREDNALDVEDGQETERASRIDIAGDDAVDNHSRPTEPALSQQQGPPANAWTKLVDWFWGDIEAPGTLEPLADPNEEMVGEGEDAQQAPFVPVQGGQPAIPDNPHHEEEQQNDPEVVAAAQQAGLDAEAIEDAEDLEGILELIGLQGPLIGLFQTSCFCSVLVTGTVFGAVGLPYVWGKLVLSFIGAPVTFLVKTPLQVASFIADLLIDLTLLVVGWFVFVLGLGVGLILSVFTTWAPTYRDSDAFQWITKFVTSTAANAGYRLQNLLLSEAPVGYPGMPGWNWAFLSASVHAHASLKTLEAEVNSMLNRIGHFITSVVETISSGSTSFLWGRVSSAMSHVHAVPAKLLAGLEALGQYTRPWLDIIGNLRNGTLVIPSEQVPMDPALVYWNSNDRGLAVLAGYMALAALATIYVAADTPITRSQAGQKAEKVVRDSLRQAGGVFKVILIISIEMLVFPLYCGLLLDIASLPLFNNASVATRWAFAVHSPYTFCFWHWFVGTGYMFHFALFVAMCRKILRKGVLWFIRDPDDPTFHPVRDVLERNVITQLRKIAFSALVYGLLVSICLGGVIWSIGRVFKGIFPINWISTDPVLEFPFDLFLYNLVVPLSIKLFNTAKIISTMYAWWLRHCARGLRLSHFLFDDRRKDEEGTHVHTSWISFLMMKKASPERPTVPSKTQLTKNGELPEVYFKRDGKYVLTPCNDQYRPPKPGEAFLHADDEDVYIADKDGKKSDHFAKVYVPPFFRLRVTLFMVCLWLFSAFAGLCATLVPLVFGRYVLKSLLPVEIKVNDIYAHCIGAYILGGCLYIAFKGQSGAQYLRQKVQAIDVQVWVETSKKYGTRALKCAYVYGFAATVVPAVVVMLLQLYFLAPLHTYMHSALGPLVEDTLVNVTGLNLTISAPTNGTNLTTSFVQNGNQTGQAGSTRVVEHNIYALSDGALGFMLVNLCRTVVTAPGSRGAEAVRRVFADGYFNPNARLATRFFILPVVLIGAILLVAPLGLAQVIIGSISFFIPAAVGELGVLIYRFSYPMAAGLVAIGIGSKELSRATSRWRSRIRDEVYLVGERLHNFGEKKPPAGSRSVVRRDR